MRILNAADVRRALPMLDAVQAMKQAFAALSSGQAHVPPRIHLGVERNAGLSLVMPAYVDAPNPARQALTVKVVSLFDGNQRRGLARIQAAVMAFEPDTGRPMALLEGATLTALRTAAASGAATDLLARSDCRSLALLGAGVQARSHLDAMLAVRPIERIRVYCRTPANGQRMIDEWVAARGDVSRMPEITLAKSPREALAGADLVCTTTTSSEPVFEDADLPAGAHVNAVGSYQPQVREIPPETVVRARVVVDSREAAWSEAGDLIQPCSAGLIVHEHVHAELGELVLGQKSGRANAEEITFFKSVGIAVQDAVAAQFALANAMRLNIGTEVEW